MARRNTTILIYFFLLLLAAAIIAFNRFIKPQKATPPEKGYTAKLAELKADLMQAAKAGQKQQPSSSGAKRATTRKSPKARPT
jgi:hypothetical protein